MILLSFPTGVTGEPGPQHMKSPATELPPALCFALKEAVLFSLKIFVLNSISSEFFNVEEYFLHAVSLHEK